jgi:hypothetical protein
MQQSRSFIRRDEIRSGRRARHGALRIPGSQAAREWLGKAQAGCNPAACLHTERPESLAAASLRLR